MKVFPPLFLAGPTAVGKSDVAVELARKISGEIISVDSMQVYRGLDIGTAKPAPAIRAEIPHHLVDILNLTETFDAAKFVARAGQAVKEVQARGHVPIFCGGTGLYFKAYLEGLMPLPETPLELRAILEDTPLATLLEELRERDPATYDKIDKKNLRRVVRAVEVIRLSGVPLSTQRTQWEAPVPTPAAAPGVDKPQPFFIGFDRPAVELHERISVRVDAMFREGLVEETQRLLKQGLAENRTALQAIGYQQVYHFIRGGSRRHEVIELVKIRTRQYAKRQRTWFRNQKAVAWWTLTKAENPAEVAVRLAAAYATHLERKDTVQAPTSESTGHCG